METETAYNVDIVNRLSGITESDQEFRARNGPTLMSSVLQDLFAQYRVYELFGLILLHRHFLLREDQALVDVNGTSTAWDLKDASKSNNGTFEKYGGSIQPCSWLVFNGHLVPYEFFFERHASRNNDNRHALFEENPRFLAEFVRILELYGLTDVIGLCLARAPRQKKIEVTEGKANVNFAVSDDVDITGSNHLETTWFYEAAESGNEAIGCSGPHIRSTCLKSCYSYNGSHMSSHRKIPSPKPSPKSDL